MKCAKCESVGKKPAEGVHKVIGPNGVKTVVCNDCLNDIDATTDIDFILELNENQEDERIFGEDS